ncbi:MAG: hypothetical protein Phyf2KO_03450 [Phycisphaerales bacterium]
MSRSAPETDTQTRTASLAFGPYELVRELRPSGVIERHLALHPELLTHHVAYRFRFGATKAERRRFLDAVEKAAALNIPHTLRVEQFSLATATEAWVISPYTGNHDGLMLLSDLLAVKGGQMESLEVTRVLSQLLEAIGEAHDAGVVHGPLSIDEIHVDRSGSLDIELYGVKAAILDDLDSEELAREELRSIVSLAYHLLTGVVADEMYIEPTKLVTKIDTQWDVFFAEGLDPAAGFANAEEVLAAVPGRRAPVNAPEIKTRNVSAFGFGRKKKAQADQAR